MAQRVVIPGFRKIEVSGGGEGGTSNYNDLTNKPSINNVPLVGNLNTANLKLTDATLTEEGVPAEAKTVGQKLEENSASLLKLKKQLGNHTVKSDVPENAVFTDTVYDYSALLGYDIYNIVSLKDATYPANKTWLSKDFIAPFDGYVFFMVQTDGASGAFSQVFKEDGVLISENQKMIADFNTWGEAYHYKIYKGKTYHFHSYNNTATAFNKVMLCIRKKLETPTEYVPYAPSNVALAEKTTNLDKRISDNGYGEIAGGKNLAKVHSFSTPKNEIIFTKKDDSTLIANGSNYNEVVGLSNEFLAKAGITYTAQIITDLQLSIFIWNTDEQTKVVPITISSKKVVSFSLTKDTHISIAIYAINAVFNNTEIKVQLEEGSVATEYEPYFPSNKMLAEDVASLLKRIETLESLVNKTDTTAVETE